MLMQMSTAIKSADIPSIRFICALTVRRSVLGLFVLTQSSLSSGPLR